MTNPNDSMESPYHEIVYHRMDIPARRKECFSTMAEKRKDNRERKKKAKLEYVYQNKEV